jgi:hypothetical protein
MTRHRQISPTMRAHVTVPESGYHLRWLLSQSVRTTNIPAPSKRVGRQVKSFSTRVLTDAAVSARREARASVHAKHYPCLPALSYFGYNVSVAETGLAEGFENREGELEIITGKGRSEDFVFIDLE